MSETSRLLLSLDFSELELKILAMGKVEYVDDPKLDKSRHGWCIVFKGNDGVIWDAVGPFKNEEEARLTWGKASE